MEYELVTEDEYATLPADPLKKFAALEQICRRRMTELISNETQDHFDVLVRTQYMTIVSSAAEELGVPGVQYQDNYSSINDNLQEFLRQVSGAVARIRLRSLPLTDPLSVRLGNRTKGIIEAELSKLRETVSESQLEDLKKRRLLSKIEDFRTELHKERLNFGISMAALAFIGSGLVGTTAVLADGPTAVATIVSLIGKDKELEEAETLRLDGPKTVPRLENKSVSTTPKTSRYADDDIPF